MSNRTGAYLVTGAGSGIGQAIAFKLMSEGNHVFGLGRDPKKLETTARLGAANFNSASVDLSRAADVSRACQVIKRWLLDQKMPLLGLVNNAGVFDRASFLQTSDAIWEKQFQTNLMSAVRLAREFHEDLKSASGSMLNISSTLGLRPVNDTSAYSAIKAAMVNWTKALALEWAPDKIRVNCICPGLVDTPIHAFHGGDDASEARVGAHAMQPLKRLGKPEDIAEAAWFLLSEKSSWTTGAVVSVDGGIGL